MAVFNARPSQNKQFFFNKTWAIGTKRMTKLEQFVSVPVAAIWGIPRGPLIFLWIEKHACGSSTWPCRMPQDDCYCSLSRLEHISLHKMHRSHCASLQSVSSQPQLWIYAAGGFWVLRHFGYHWSADVGLRPCGSSTNRSGAWREANWEWNSSAFLSPARIVLNQPTPNEFNRIDSCSGLLLRLPLREISNLWTAGGRDWHVGHDWFSGKLLQLETW